jgi:methyl-accepting chemotaxis protein
MTEVSQGAEAQVKHLRNVDYTLQEIRQAAHGVKQGSSEVTALARNIEGVAQAKRTEIDRALGILVDVKHSVELAAQEIRALNATVTDINRFVASVGQIADQTNLLALNAAIEAARAGDAGRGFAVVAGEVRKLAERSIRSTESIREIISAVQDETNATIMATEQGAKQAREVGELMTSTVDVLDESLRASDQQRVAAEQVSGAMVEIRSAAEQLASEEQLRAATAEKVDGLVDDLERKLAELAALAGNGAAPVASGNGASAR